MVGGIIGLFILDYRMTLMVLLFIPVKAVIMKHFAKKRKRSMDEFNTESEKDVYKRQALNSEEKIGSVGENIILQDNFDMKA